MSLNKDEDEESFEFEEIWLNEILANQDFPAYRRVFTKSTVMSQIFIKGGEAGNWQFEKNQLTLEMPFVKLAIDDEKAAGQQPKYKKYLEPNEFNVIIQNKFEEWT